MASTQYVYRTQRSISRSADCPFYLIMQLHSAWHVRQPGRSTALRAGDAVLVDASEKYELYFPQSVDRLSVQLPRAWVNRCLVDAPRTPRKPSRATRVGAALCRAVCCNWATT